MRAPTLQQFNLDTAEYAVIRTKKSSYLSKSLPYPNRTGDPLIPPCVFHDVTRVIIFRSLVIYSQLLFQLS